MSSHAGTAAGRRPPSPGTAERSASTGRTPVLYGVIVFVVGCVVVPIAVGIAMPHLVKVGMQPTSVAGLLLLVIGLVLLFGGGAVLVRATPGWRKVAVVPVMLVTAVVALVSLGQAVAVTHVPRTAVGSATPADRGLSFSEVEFATPDGVRLSGWYVPSRNTAAIVLLHGAGSTRSDVLDHAVVLARSGYGVLLFDARGHGRSDGRAMDFGWYGDADIAGAVSFLQARPDVDDERIAAVGLSMGGEEAIGAAAADERIRAVVAEGATNRVTGDKAWLPDAYGLRGALQQGVDWLTYTATDLLTAAEPPIVLREAAATAARPMLLITAGTVPDEAEAARYIRSGSPDTITLWTAPAAGHTGALATYPEEWSARTSAFLADALGVVDN